jgi:tRNA threonylcarbamoyladenosine biosynthesis protein TsaB
MALILNIDTATEMASICLSKDGNKLSLLENKQQKDHASWLHVGIDEIMKSNGFMVKDLDAVAITDGPGSYTGLRVGMAAAKGLCYALQIPFITESSLKMMAFAAGLQINNVGHSVLCPMIDARRMEVFTAIYNFDLEELIPPASVILDEYSFFAELESLKIHFFGSGSPKWEKITASKNAMFAEVTYHAGHLSGLSYKKFLHKEFTDIIYSQPAYIKDFHTYNKK